MKSYGTVTGIEHPTSLSGTTSSGMLRSCIKRNDGNVRKQMMGVKNRDNNAK